MLASVNHSDTQTTPPIEPTAEEAKLLQQLRSNPIMAEKFGLIMERFEQEIANGADANQAEMMVIEELRILGETMLGQWAEKTQTIAINQAKAESADLIHHKEKTPLAVSYTHLTLPTMFEV